MAIERITLPNGEVYSLNEWIHWPQFSTFEAQGGIGAATDPLGLGNGISVNADLFTYQVSQQVPRFGAIAPRSATTSDTNQVVGSRMNYDEAFLCYSVTYEIFALDSGTEMPTIAGHFQSAEPAFIGTNLRRLQRDCIFELRLGAGISKPQIRAPFSYYGQGIGATAFGPGDALAAPPSTINMDYGTGGGISPRNQRAYVLPVYIANDTVMKGKFWSPDGQIAGVSQSYRMRWYLDGLKKRPVA
jgi:hypothetical protein